jgi:hypothetical protein
LVKTAGPCISLAEKVANSAHFFRHFNNPKPLVMTPAASQSAFLDNYTPLVAKVVAVSLWHTVLGF